MGETNITAEALGAPLRLAYNADGSVKFSKSGRPVTKVAKELSDNIRLVRENFTASLQSYANGVIAENPEGYKAQVKAAEKAGEPILTKDRRNLEQAIAKMRQEELDKAIADAEAKAKEHKPAPEKVKAGANA